MPMQTESTTTSTEPQDQAERPGYKKTKLGLIPEEWSTPMVPEVFKFLKTTSFSRSKMNYADKGVFCIHYGDIHATYQQPILDFNEDANIPRLNHDVKLPANMHLLKNGDLIIADASEDYEGIGSAIEITNLNGKKALSGLHTFAFRDIGEKTVEGFRSYIFKNPQVKKALKTIATGSKVYGVSKGNLEKFKIVLPTLPEQQKIAKILSTWDAAIAKQEQFIAAKETFKKGLMQVLLTGKKRFEGFEGEWEERKVSDIFKMQAGKDLKKDSFSEAQSNVYRYPVFSNALTNEGLYGYYDFFQFDGGKITVSARGSLGYSKARRHCFSAIGRLLVLTPKIDVSLFFVSEFINNVLRIFVESPGVPQLTAPQFGIYKLKLPATQEQYKIASVLSEADKEIEFLKQKLVQLQDQKQGLMQRLLTGEVRVRINDK